MKKVLCVVLSIMLMLGVFSGCDNDAKMQTAFEKLSEYTSKERADLVALALPMLLTDAGLDLASDLILGYNPNSNSLYNTLLHPVFKVIDQKTALAALKQIYKIDEALRSKYFEGFQKRVGLPLSVKTHTTLDMLMTHEYEKYPGLEKICKEDGITAPVLAHFLGLPIALNGGAPLLTDANAVDFKAGKINALLESIVLGATENEKSAAQAIDELVIELNARYSAGEKRLLKLALQEIGLYEATEFVRLPSGMVVENEQNDAVQNGFGYKVLKRDAISGDSIEIAYYKNGQADVDVSLTESLKIVVPVNTENVMLYYNGTPVKYTTYADGMLYCSVDHLGIYTVCTAPQYFTDANGWGKAYIEALYHRGIISGKAEGMFDPEARITREEFVKLVVELFGLTDATLQSGFADVPTNAWYAPYVASAKHHGIVNGLSVVRFGVGEPITRQDMCKILYEMIKKMNLPQAGESESIAFNDAASIASYAQQPVQALVSLGIIQGDNLGNFNPQNNATRQEAAKLIYGMLALYVR